MSCPPIGVVSSRTVIRGFGVKRAIFKTIFLIHGRNIVVTETYSHLRSSLEFCTQLPCRYAFQHVGSMTVHHVIALTVFGIVIIPPVVVLACLVTCIQSTIVGVFITGAQGQEVTDGMTQAKTKLPRGIELEVIFLSIIDGTSSIAHRRVVARGQVIPCGGSHRKADTEWRVFYGTEDDT